MLAFLHGLGKLTTAGNAIGCCLGEHYLGMPLDLVERLLHQEGCHSSGGGREWNRYLADRQVSGEHWGTVTILCMVALEMDSH